MSTQAFTSDVIDNAERTAISAPEAAAKTEPQPPHAPTEMPQPEMAAPHMPAMEPAPAVTEAAAAAHKEATPVTATPGIDPKDFNLAQQALAPYLAGMLDAPETAHLDLTLKPHDVHHHAGLDLCLNVPMEQAVDGTYFALNRTKLAEDTMRALRSHTGFATLLHGEAKLSFDIPQDEAQRNQVHVFLSGLTVEQNHHLITQLARAQEATQAPVAATHSDPKVMADAVKDVLAAHPLPQGEAGEIAKSVLAELAAPGQHQAQAAPANTIAAPAPSQTLQVAGGKAV